MPLTEEEKRQIEEEERQRLEAMKPSWRENLAGMFDWATQGSPKNPLTWQQIASPLDFMLPTAPLTRFARNIPNLIKAYQGDPEAQENLSQNARGNLNSLVAGATGTATGGPVSGAINAAMAGGTPARDAGDLAETAVTTALGGAAARLPIKWGASALANTRDIPGKANVISNIARQAPLSLGIAGAGQAAASGVRGEDPLSARPIEVGTKALTSLLFPGMAAVAQKAASTSNAAKLRSFYDRLLGKGTINKLGTDMEREVTQTQLPLTQQSAQEIDQATDAYMAPRRTEALGSERALQSRIDQEAQNLRNIKIQQADIALARAENEALFGKTRLEANPVLNETDAARALKKFELKTAKNINLKDIAKEMDDVVREGGVVQRNRTLSSLLKESAKHPQGNEDGTITIYNPETGKYDILYGTAEEQEALARKIVELGNPTLQAVKEKTLAQRAVISSRVGSPPPNTVLDVGRELSPAEKSWANIQGIEEAIHKLDQEKLKLKGGLSTLGEETKGVNRDLNIARAELEKTAAQKVALVGDLKKELDALLKFHEKNPILPGTARELTGKSINPGLPLGQANAIEIGSKFIDPPGDATEYAKRLTTLRDTLNIVRDRFPDGGKIIKNYQNIVKGMIALRTYSTSPDTVLGGADPFKRGEMLSLLFGKDEGYRIAHNIAALQTSVGQARKILGHLTADRTAAQAGDSVVRSLAYQGTHGNPIPLIAAAGVGISFIPVPFVKQIMEDPALGRQFQAWATEGGLMVANLRYYPVLSNAVAKWPVTIIDKTTGQSKRSTIGAVE